MAKTKKEKKQAEPYWQELVSLYFHFCKEKFHDIPTFEGSAPRDLKSIIASLRKRCQDGGNEWTVEAATGRLRHFLEYCFMDRWLSENFILRNLNSQKDKIFFQITKEYLSR